jgi:hypothetical protein
VFAVHLRLTRTVVKPAAAAQFEGKHAVSDDVGALDEVLLHYVPELEPEFEETYATFLRSLPRTTRVLFVIRRGRRAAFDAFVARIDPREESALRMRTRVVEIDVALGIWSKDRALVLSAGHADGKTTLLVPPVGGSSRPFDAQIVPAVAKSMPDRNLDVVPLPIAFDAGDFAVAGRKVIFDANLLGRNRARGFATAAALRERMFELLGRDVVMLGLEDGDVPRHHMSMYMAPLPGGTVLVGDPSIAAKIVGERFEPGEVSPETSGKLVADFSAAMQSRFDRAARDLARAGFRVVRIPNVPFDDKTYFAYTNGIYETRDGRRRAWVPKFDVPALDRAAFEVYEKEGLEVIPVGVRKLYPQHGTLGCVVNILSRT